MAHNHGNEYQIRIVHEDGTEELSGLMYSTEQVTQAMIAAHRPQGKAYWLLVRNILCPDCSDSEQRIMECPLWISRLQDICHTTPVICKWWSRGTGTLWAFQHQGIRRRLAHAPNRYWYYGARRE